ncbi:MAG: transporter substrate-binding domain-containing protein [Christensenellales bacterium]
MKRTLKLFIAALLVLATILTLASCGSGLPTKTDAPAATKAPTAAPTAAATTKPTATAAPAVLKMGTNAAFPPFEYKEGQGFAGIDIEICEAIAKNLGMKLEVVDMEFDALLDSLDAGMCDFVAAGMTVRPDGEQKVDFTVKYYRSTQVVIVDKANTAIVDQASLKNLKIGAQAGTTGEEAARNIEGAEVSSFQSGAEAVLALNNGQIDAVIIDAEPAKNFVSSNTNLKIVEVGFADEYYAMAVKKNNTELFKKIDGALQALIKDGTVDKIIAKFITK